MKRLVVLTIEMDDKKELISFIDQITRIISVALRDEGIPYEKFELLCNEEV